MVLEQHHVHFGLLIFFLVHCFIVLVACRREILQIYSNLTNIFLFDLVRFVRFLLEEHSLNHDLLTIINIYACARGLGGEAAAVEGEPRIRIRVIRVIRGRNNSRGLVVAEVDVERGEAAGAGAAAGSVASSPMRK